MTRRRLLITVIVVAVFGAIGFVGIDLPGPNHSMQPMWAPDPAAPPWGLVLTAAAFILFVMGLAIIRWITRDPEDGSDHWRSHRKP